MRSSREEAREGEQRSKRSTYCNKAEPPGSFLSSKSAFKVWEKKEGLPVKSCGVLSRFTGFLSTGLNLIPINRLWESPRDFLVKLLSDCPA